MRFKFLLLFTFLLASSSLSQPTLKEKIAQMIMVGFSGTSVPDSLRYDIQNRKLGGVVLFASNINNPTQIKNLTAQLQSYGNNQLLISIDQEGGRVARLNQNNGFAATNSAYKLGTVFNREDSTRQTAKVMAGWLSQNGINVNLAPVADVNVNPNSPAIGKLDRSYSKIPDTVSSHISWFMDEFHKKNILTTLKHFPGHGSAATDSHLGFTDITETWADSELVPFSSAINQGIADLIMIGHLFNSNIDSLHPASLSFNAITKLLRDTLGFNGVVISDELFMQAISANYTLEEAVELCIKAGTDILLFNKSIHNNKSLAGYLVDVVSSKINQGVIAESLIDSSYNRIQRLKQRFVTEVQFADAEIPGEFILYQNYPNPFNPSTKIRYTIPALTPSLSQRERVMLKVFDILGNEVATLVNDEKSPGTYEVEFSVSSGSASSNKYPVSHKAAGSIVNLASGIYFYRLQAGTFAQTRKMMLLH